MPRTDTLLLSRLTSKGAVESYLPERARLYGVSGARLLFERIETSKEMQFDASWLYVPRTRVELATDSGRGGAEAGSRTGSPIELDDWIGQPLVVGDQVLGIVVQPAGEQVALTREQVQGLCSYLQSRRNVGESNQGDVADLFITQLFQRNGSTEQFAKRLLSLLSGEWEGSCAGLYVESRGLQNLLLATGDVNRYYHLARQLTPETSFAFAAASCDADHFLPAELMPNHPTFLNAPPDLYFIHQGMTSERSSQLLVIAGPGNIALTVARRLEEIARLARLLRESQFATGTELLDYYHTMSLAEHREQDIDSVLTQLVALLGRQVRLSRLVIGRIPKAEGPVTGRSYVVHPTEGVRVHALSGTSYHDSIVESVRAGKAYHVRDLTDAFVTEKQAKDRYLENVISELCLPAITSRGVVGFVGFGSPVAGPYLAEMQPLLANVVDFVSLWFSMDDMLDSREVPATSSSHGARMSASRLEAVRKLTEGQLHSMSEALSVMIGQADIMRSEGDVGAQNANATRYDAALGKMSSAADRLAGHLANLRHICELSRGSELNLKPSDVLATLSDAFSGLVQRIKDSRNLDIQISAEAGGDLVIRSGDLLDVILPVIIAIAEHAICSGSISVSATEHGQRAELRLSFKKRLIDHLAITDLLHDLFPTSDLVACNAREGHFALGDALLEYRSEQDDIVVIRLNCASRSSVLQATHDQTTPLSRKN